MTNSMSQYIIRCQNCNKPLTSSMLQCGHCGHVQKPTDAPSTSAAAASMKSLELVEYLRENFNNRYRASAQICSLVGETILRNKGNFDLIVLALQEYYLRHECQNGPDDPCSETQVQTELSNLNNAQPAPEPSDTTDWPAFPPSAAQRKYGVAQADSGHNKLFSTYPRVVTTPAPDLLTRLQSGNRSIGRSELGAAIDLMAQGKVEPVEGVDFQRMPEPPARKPVKLSKGELKMLKSLPRNLADQPLKGYEKITARTLSQKRLVQTLGLFAHQKTLSRTEAGDAALRENGAKAAPPKSDPVNGPVYAKLSDLQREWNDLPEDDIMKKLARDSGVYPAGINPDESGKK